jgi:hypothetical protein
VKDLTELAMAGTRWWLDAWTAQANAMTTIALRLPIVMADPHGHEARRMVSEKVVAAGQGGFAAAAKAGEAMMAAAAGAGPVASARAMLAVVEAASRPAKHRVRKNARRLMRKPGG